MDFANLLDATSAVIVVGGTTVATFLRCGVGDCGHTLAALAQIGRPRFDGDKTRAELAVQIQDIRNDGLLRAQPHHFGDREFDEAAGALIGSRSLAPLIHSHEIHKSRRLDASNRAVRTLSQAAELAPVFGLAGTLISLSQLPVEGIAKGHFATAIGMAVLTTLYGLLLANIILAPLARVVERIALAEERERQKLVDWLAGEVADALPRRKPAPVGAAA